MQTITLGLEEEEVLRSSVLMDICNGTELTLYRLERALELLSIDRQHAIAMRDSNLFGRLVARYEQNNEPESRCLVLRCLSEAMENMCRNEVYVLAKIIADAQLGPWCVGELMLSIERDQFICSELLKFASHLVKVSKHDRDYVISRFVLPQFPWLFRNHRDAILFLIKNATLHESHSADMLDLFETVLSAVMAHCVELSERRFNYHLVVNIVNNYVFDRCENIDRCISSFLYGTALASPAERYSFFEASGLPDSAGLRYFNRFVSSLVGSTGNMTLTCVSDSSEVTDIGMKEIFRRSWNDTSCVLAPHVSSYSDTAAFDILPGKCKISRTRKESMSGGTVWTFSNGMKVVYKHLPAGGRFWYSLVLKKGFSSVPDLEPGQGAFFSDILGLYKVAGMKHDDFDSLLSAMDIVMERNVGPVDMSLSGNAASGSLEFLLKSLVSISKDSAADSAAFDYYLKCEKLRLQETGGVEERLVAIDSIISPDFRYSRFKAPSRLTRDLLHVADSYFRNQFERINDGVLVLVGDLDEFALKKTLQEYIGSFPVSKRMLPVRVQGAELVSGGSTYTVNGRETSLDVVMSVPARLDIQSYMASEMAAMALYDAAVASMAGMAASLNVSGNFSTVPSERLNIAVSVDACDTAYFAEGVTGMKPVRALFALRSVLRTLSTENLPQSMLDTYKSTLKNAISSRSNDPDYWVEAVSRRFIYGKDFHTDYSGKIDAVTADNVREIIYSLDNGAKVEYIVRPKRKTK